MVAGCVCRIDDGWTFVTSPSRQSRTAFALRASGTMQRTSRAFRIWRIDMEIARRGTSSRVANQPSPSCCRRHASSSSTTRYGSSVSKSAGGSLKARWPFSPMPTKATSTGDRARSAPTRRHSAAGSAASPARKWNVRGWTRSTMRSRRYRRKLAGWVSLTPTYSSRWNTSTRPHSTPGASVSASRNSNCEAPVAAITRASPARAIASSMAAAARSAAARPSSAFVSKIRTSISSVLLSARRHGRPPGTGATASPSGDGTAPSCECRRGT